MTAAAQNALSSLTGNVPKAILCVRKPPVTGSSTTMKQVAEDTASLQKSLLKSTEEQLNGLTAGNKIASQTFGSLTGTGGALAGSNYLALEVQYNPSSIYMDTQAGSQVQYSGGALGNGSNNQIIQSTQPASTTMSFQLIFDDMNPSDAFMLENTAPTVGNAVSGVSSLAKKAGGGGYSVQAQMDGLIALLASDVTRQVIFFWAKMCFRGEVVSASSRYTMFNKDGNPIRGVVDLSIRQGDGPDFEYETLYWDQAFTNIFGDAMTDMASGGTSTFSKLTNNNILNLNL